MGSRPISQPVPEVMLGSSAAASRGSGGGSSDDTGRHEQAGSVADVLAAGDPAALLRAPEEVSSPVWRVVLERVRAGSRPRQRADERVVCLAVEGGGMRGAVSAGMGVVLEAAGLTCASDRIYGVSAGALNGGALAVGQAALSATDYQDAASRGVVNRMRPLVGRSVIDFELLFEQLIAARKPLSLEGLASGPEFRALATSLETLSLRVLAGFADIDELMRAVRASASLPMLGGEPPIWRGERIVDGGLLDPIPIDTALGEGATHVLVLRSRPAGYRQPAVRGLTESFVLRDHPGLVRLQRARPRGLQPPSPAARAGSGRQRSRRSRASGRGPRPHAPDRPAGEQRQARHRSAPTGRPGDGLGDSDRPDRSLLATGGLSRDTCEGSGQAARPRFRGRPERKHANCRNECLAGATDKTMTNIQTVHTVHPQREGLHGSSHTPNDQT